MNLFLQKAKKHYGQNLPFVLYSKPNSDVVNGLLQQDSLLYSVVDFNEKGFVFASFDGTKTILIPENKSEKISFTLERKNTPFSESKSTVVNLVAKNNFETLVAKGIKSIQNNEFQKVVLSRKETIDLDDFDFLHTFQNLVNLYSSTFVYCFFHPKVGIWLGATPEQLLQSEGQNFKTIALAGTQKDNGTKEIIWKTKEQDEQRFVTDYIVAKLQNIASEVLVSEPYSIKAGAIWHIKTDISGVLDSDSSLQKFTMILHPTPAVCGLPTAKARTFIQENENYDRTFYTGFLGELNRIPIAIGAVAKNSDLFVNLRCMELERNENQKITKAHLYIGCGITKDSIPEKEWEESVNKSLTMRRMLDLRK
jgi:isochorismate synthase